MDDLSYAKTSMKESFKAYTYTHEEIDNLLLTSMIYI